MTWQDSPGIQDAFTYLPWTTVLLAPGRWLGGDVRWALAFWSGTGVSGSTAGTDASEENAAEPRERGRLCGAGCPPQGLAGTDYAMR